MRATVLWSILLLIALFAFFRGCYTVGEQDRETLSTTGYNLNNDVQFIKPIPYVDSAVYYDSVSKIDSNVIRESIGDNPAFRKRGKKGALRHSKYYTEENRPGTSKEANRLYPGSWKLPNRNEFIVIGKALSKNNITGCGEYYVRQDEEISGEYLVACTADSQYWIYYIVWVHSGEAMSVDINRLNRP